MKRELLSTKWMKQEIANLPRGRYEMDDDGFVHASTTTGFQIESNFLSFLPDEKGCYLNVNFKTAIDFICCRGLVTLEGCPRIVINLFEIVNAKITSIDGICEEAKTVNLKNCRHLTSLHGIHKQLKKCEIISVEPEVLKSHLLGLLMIRGLQQIDYQFVAGMKSEGYRAVMILNKYLQIRKETGITNSGDFGDIIDCQQELMENGLKAFAKL